MMAKTNVKAVSKTTSKPTKKQTDPKAAAAKDLLKTITKPMTYAQQLAYLSKVTNLTKKDVGLVIDSLFTIIDAHLKKTGLINLAGLMKIYLVQKAATKAREGINRLTGQPTIFKAKPARKIVRIKPFKKLKEII